MKNKDIKSKAAIRLELGAEPGIAIMNRVEYVMLLLQSTIKTGKNGRPKKLITAKQARKLLGFKASK